MREMIAGPWLVQAWAGDALGDPHWVYLREAARTWWWPTVRVMNVAMWAALAAAALWLLRPGPQWIPRVGFAVAALGYAGALWLFDGLEMWRHVLPAMAGLVPAALASTGQAGITHPTR